MSAGLRPLTSGKTGEAPPYWPAQPPWLGRRYELQRLAAEPNRVPRLDVDALYAPLAYPRPVEGTQIEE